MCSFPRWSALLLRKARHDGDEQFALSVKRPDVFFLKIALNAMIFEFPDRSQAVDRVSGKAADRFCDDEVYPTRLFDTKQ